MYKQNENDIAIENGFFKVFMYFLAFLKMLNIFITGYKFIFKSLYESKKLIYKLEKSELTICIFKVIISLIGLISSIIGIVYYYKFINENIPFTNQMYLLNLKYFIFVLIIGLVLNVMVFIQNKLFILKNNTWKNQFEKINFIDANKETPDLMLIEKFEYYEVLYFESYIPIDVWKKNLIGLKQVFNNEIEVKQFDEQYTTKLITRPIQKLKKVIYFKEDYISKQNNLISIGFDLFHRFVYIDFNLYPHGLISGDTGSGKSTLLKIIYIGLKKQNKKMILIDLKGSTLKLFKKYEDSKKIYSNIDEVLNVLIDVEKVHDKRLKEINMYDDIEDINQWNEAIENGKIKGKKYQEIFILIDEIARITVDEAKNKKTIEIIRILTKIAQVGRSQGFHILFITQRPDTDTLPPKIRSMLSIKISGVFKEKYTAEMAINDKNAFDNFPEIKGRMLILQQDTRQFQGFFINNSDLDTILLNESEYKVSLEKI